MELYSSFKSVLEQDPAPVVICDLDHTVMYMNPSALNRYGATLLGRSLLVCHHEESRKIINRVLQWFREDNAHNIIFESHNDEENKDVYIVALRDDSGKLIGYYEKHEYRTQETAAFYDFGDNTDE